jgi:hypothetical protein
MIERELAASQAEVEKIKQKRNRIGVEIRGEYLPKLNASQAEVARLQKELDATCNAEELRQERETRKRAEAEVARLNNILENTRMSRDTMIEDRNLLDQELAASKAEVAKLNHQLLKTESDLLQSQDINSFLDTEFRIACKRAEKAEAEVERLTGILKSLRK